MDYSTHESCYNSIMSAARPRYSIRRLLILSIISLAGCTANPVVTSGPTIPAALQSAPILPTRTIETTPLTPTPLPTAVPAREAATRYYTDGVQAYAAHRYTDALLSFTQAAELDPNNALIYMSRAAVYQGLKDFDGALADYTQALL